MRFRRNLGGVILAALIVLPWVLSRGAGGWGGLPPERLNLLGREAGVLGLSLLLLATLISARVPGLDAWFGGLTRLWKVHHGLGAASFLLLMVHPLLLAFSAATSSPQAAAAVLFPAAGAWGVWVGWGALASMAVFLAPTFSFFGPPRYQRWKALHALSGAVVFLGAAHGIALNRLLPGWRGAAFWAGGGCLALAAYAYRMVLARWVGGASYVVSRVDRIGRGVVELSLKPEGNLLKYRAGQFVYLTPFDESLACGRGEEHPYTVSSSPSEALLRIAVKDLGDATRALQTVSMGSRVLVEGPYGGLFEREDVEGPELWIAGGIGLTPFLGRLRSLEPARAVDVHLIYCVEDESRAHFLAELEAVAARIRGFNLWVHLFRREGVLDGVFLRSRCRDLTDREIFICGPPPFIGAVRRGLRREGVSRGRIHSEDFAWI